MPRARQAGDRRSARGPVPGSTRPCPARITASTDAMIGERPERQGPDHRAPAQRPGPMKSLRGCRVRFSQLALAVRLALLRLVLTALLLLLLLIGAMTAVDAARGGAEQAVMAGIVAGDAADHRSLDAALGVGGLGGQQRARGDG